MDPLNLYQSIKNISINLDKAIKATIDAGGFWSYLVFFIVILLGCAIIFLAWLPSDVLVFLCGTLAGSHHLDITLVIIIGTLAAFLGNQFKYLSARHNKKISSKVKNNKVTAYFNKDSAQAVLTANLLPYIGNVIPMIAGYEQMEYKKYSRYNFEGALIWIGMVALLGFFSIHVSIIKHNMVLSSIVISILIGVAFKIFQSASNLLKKKLH